MSSEATKSKKSKTVSDRNQTRTFFEVWRDWFVAFVKYLWKKFHSPLGIWMFSVWLTSVIIMGITNTLRGGSFWNGPYYWMQIFLTYGLNFGQEPQYLFISKSFLPWIFSPMIVLTLGITLYILPNSGYFRNGGLPIEEKDFKNIGMFFNSDNIWGSELVNPSHPKWTKTYLWIVFMPIVIGTTIAAFYNFFMFKKHKKQRYLPKAKNVLLWHLLACIITGIEMALLTGNIEIHLSEIFYSLFVDRKANNVLIYGLQYNKSGQYHPISLALSMWLINLTAFFLVYLIFLIIGNLDNIGASLKSLYAKIKRSIEARKTIDFTIGEAVSGNSEQSSTN